MMGYQIDIIIPVYNESINVLLIYNVINTQFEMKAGFTPRFIFIDDGSEDDSLVNIKKLAALDERVKYLSFSRNFGKDSALTAGLHYSNGDAAVMLDADLQHPPEIILQMLHYWNSGYQVIYCKRNSANEYQGFFTRFFSRVFYKLMTLLSDVKIEEGISDFRLIDKKVVAVLKKWNEYEPFYRGLTKWIGFTQKSIEYTPQKRIHGRSKYSKSALFHLAFQAITSFSTRPLHIATYLGFIFSIASLLYIPYVSYSYYYHYAVSGWTSMIATIAFFGGLQLMILGIIGLYLSKLFIQSKGRPLYIVNQSNLDE